MRFAKEHAVAKPSMQHTQAITWTFMSGVSVAAEFCGQRCSGLLALRTTGMRQFPNRVQAMNPQHRTCTNGLRTE